MHVSLCFTLALWSYEYRALIISAWNLQQYTLILRNVMSWCLCVAAVQHSGNLICKWPNQLVMLRHLQGPSLCALTARGGGQHGLPGCTRHHRRSAECCRIKQNSERKRMTQDLRKCRTKRIRIPVHHPTVQHWDTDFSLLSCFVVSLAVVMVVRLR